MHISDKKKTVEFRWIKYPIAGILYCSCGKDNNFRGGTISVTCSNCGKTMALRDYIRDYDKHLTAIIGNT